MPKPRPAQLDSPLMPKIFKYMSAAQTSVYQLSGGLLWGRFRGGSVFPRGLPVCLLTTIGRKSGRPRTKPLLYLVDGERVILVASQGGLPRHPAWYVNLLSNPRVLIQIGRHRRPMRARTATDAERDKLWPRLVAMYPDFADYQSWTERTIPVVICDPE